MKAGLVFEAIKQSVDRLFEQRRIHYSEKDFASLYEEVHQQSPIFVLSTGRTGTKLMTKLLARSKALKAYHEPSPVINYYGKAAWQRDTPDAFLEGVFDGARYELIRDAFILGKTYAETNNRITFMAKFALALYPNARFVHLIREPYSFVKSAVGHGWYGKSNIHDEGRIRPENSQGLRQVEILAWLWQETNTFISEFMKGVADPMKFRFESEDLYSNVSRTEEFLKFCGAADVTTSQIKRLQKKRVNKGKQANAPTGDVLAEIEKAVADIQTGTL